LTARVLFPGTEVPFGEGRARATVYPFGLRHAQRFSREVASLLEVVLEATPAGRTDAETALAVLRSAAPILVGNCLDLIADCVVIEPKTVIVHELPHFVQAQLFGAWLEESFGNEDKIRPWREAVRGVLQRLAGGNGTLGTIFSSFWQRVTAAPTSSIGGNQASPTAAGAIPSSGTGVSEPSVSSPGTAPTP
jgi:hypothetical protein